jgi:hypothetical protein
MISSSSEAKQRPTQGCRANYGGDDDDDDDDYAILCVKNR